MHRTKTRQAQKTRPASCAPFGRSTVAPGPALHRHPGHAPQVSTQRDRECDPPARNPAARLTRPPWAELWGKSPERPAPKHAALRAATPRPPVHSRPDPCRDLRDSADLFGRRPHVRRVTCTHAIAAVMLRRAGNAQTRRTPVPRHAPATRPKTAPKSTPRHHRRAAALPTYTGRVVPDALRRAALSAAPPDAPAARQARRPPAGQPPPCRRTVCGHGGLAGEGSC